MSSAFRAFNNIRYDVYSSNKIGEMKNEIDAKPKEYILGVDEQTYVDYLVEKYALEILEIEFQHETVTSQILQEQRSDRHETYFKEIYAFTVTFPFSGSSVIFKIHPITYIIKSTDILVNDLEKTVSYTFRLDKMDPEEFNRSKGIYRDHAFANLENANHWAFQWNASLRNFASNHFQMVKNKYVKQNDFFAAINIPIDKGTASVFTAPTVQKKIIPQPKVDSKKEITSVPTMANEMYIDVLKVIYDAGKSMERKPALYKGKDEEGLRDQFLFILETRYNATTATGETFNRAGKTDILLKYANDGTNLFVAECKFWHGVSEFLNAISQLFDGYLTWRDSKVALLLFVTNRDFSNVLSTIQSGIQSHPCFIKATGQHGESSFSYLFCLQQDSQKQVFFEVIAFHYDK